MILISFIGLNQTKKIFEKIPTLRKLLYIFVVSLLICNYFMNIKDCFFVNSKVENYIADLSYASLKEIEQKSQATSQYALNCYQIALYTDLSSVARKIQFLGYDKDFCSIFGIYSFLIDKKQINKLFLTLIRIFQQNQLLNQQKNSQNGNQLTQKTIKTKGITLIYFTQSATLRKKIFSTNQEEVIDIIDFSYFKNEVLKKLPISSLIQMNKLLVCHPGFLNKSLSYIPSFGTYNTFLQKFIQLADSIFQLCVILGPLLNCQSISKRVLQFDRGKTWRNIYSQTDKVRSLQELSYFQISQPQVASSNLKNHKFYFQTLGQYKLNSKNIPKLLKVLHKQIQTKHSRQEGIFRKACDQNELLKMQCQILNAAKNRIKIKEILVKYQPQTIASCIKKIFANLKHPLIPYEVYQKIAKLEQKQLFPKIQNKNENKPVNLIITKKSSNNENMIKTTIQNLNLANPNHHLNQDKKTIFMKNRDFFQNLSKNTTQKTNETKQKHNRIGQPLKKSEIKNTTYLIQTIFKKEKESLNNSSLLYQTNSNVLIISNHKQTNSFQNKNSKLQILLNQLKGTNQYEVFKYTLRFLSKVILVNQKYNLMSAYNLGVVFVPCFFRSKNENYKQLMLSSKFVQVLKTLILQYDQYFQSSFQQQND